MANNEVRVDFKNLTGNGFQKTNSLADRLKTLESNINGAWKNAPLGSDLGIGSSLTAQTEAANCSLAQPIQRLGAPIHNFSTLESQIKSISALGTLQDRLNDIQNDLSKLHDLSKPLGVSSLCCEPLNKIYPAIEKLQHYEDRFNLMRGGNGNLY